MTHIPHDALILIGDGEKALFLRNKGDAQYVNFVVEDIFQQDNPATREQGSDQPGRGFASAGSTRRSAMEETDWHRLGEERFAGEIARVLYARAHAGRFKELVVVAPPKVLGILRKAFHKEVAARITAEIPKALTTQSVVEIERLLTA